MEESSIREDIDKMAARLISECGMPPQSPVAKTIEAFAKRVAEADGTFQQGYDRGMAEANDKLGQALDALRAGNNALQYMKRERDAVLEELAQHMFQQANRGLLAMGYHPPGAHQDPAMIKRIGSVRCSKCKDKMRSWSSLTPDEKKKYMARTFSAIMMARAKLNLDKPFDKSAPLVDANTPTTHDLAGTAQVTEPPKLVLLPGLNDAQKITPVVDEGPDSAENPEGL